MITTSTARPDPRSAATMLGAILLIWQAGLQPASAADQDVLAFVSHSGIPLRHDVHRPAKAASSKAARWVCTPQHIRHKPFIPIQKRRLHEPICLD